ncbi:hypothetical protein HQ45_02925 [Porphyromonas crevioricanis]|uniref:Alkaline phosphatase n=2 Tax=Porphyromonas crevioricanis TaxID=393921 RepID=A0A0A2FS28_9PORP|nr:alkaline phosphatase family protein [Porphyromonas crevioricanis]KGN91069.1 hypothetical protein HQ45_02925 [Porphyromonas crevioricanis]KGN94665.1 hypothetical protein HQ38_05655 [Porphyromonas crevioricanis]SJZ57626.1 Type I phosphodiesterase / nucleotide pyrophosphatase [Porphyromonas crevioricanis]SQH73423.1 Alkaline phosphatase precursor [Porphyromonas crevioricanis]GAD06126.1 hypothetical protein PORCRE_1848 [Porphyromonas crevioricanis JCM 15906]
MAKQKQIKENSGGHSTRGILASLVAVLSVAMNVYAGSLTSPTHTPRLLLCISVDQLRSDLLIGFSPLYSQEGWRRILSGGAVYPSVDFDVYPLDVASAIASIYTGEYPSMHGIGASLVYDEETNKCSSVVEDSNYMGNYTSERYSPLALQMSTIGDELKYASAGRSSVYSIAPNPEEAILAGGQEADAAYWIENDKGRWATSTYYTKQLPWFVEKANSTPNNIGALLSGKTWKNSRKVEGQLLPYTGTFAPFYHKIGESVEQYKKTPLVNDDVTNLAISFVEHYGYELGTSPHMLSVVYTAAPYPGAMDYEQGAEMQDAYVRLDSNIARLLNAVERKIGLSNCLVMLSGTGYSSYRQPPVRSANGKRSTRNFSPERCKALLNMYLMAVYGQGQWIKSYRNNYIYLNRSLVEERKLSLEEVQIKAAQFTSEMAGVASCIPVLSRKSYIGIEQSLANGIHKQEKADLILQILPGWYVEPNIIDIRDTSLQGKYRKMPCDSPVIFFGWGIKAAIYADEKPSVRRIAPSLAHVLRIRPPCNRDIPLPAITGRLLSK